MSRKEKGATALDRLCHTLYDVPKGAGFLAAGQCQGCGGSLMTYYCEERLYLIVCQKCGAMALAKSYSGQRAVDSTLATKETKLLSRLEYAETWANVAEYIIALAMQDMKALASIVCKHKADDCECRVLCQGNCQITNPRWQEESCFSWIHEQSIMECMKLRGQRQSRSDELPNTSESDNGV